MTTIIVELDFDDAEIGDAKPQDLIDAVRFMLFSESKLTDQEVDLGLLNAITTLKGRW